MADLMQQAREFLAVAHEKAGDPLSAEAIRKGWSPVPTVELEAIAAALLSAPDGYVRVAVPRGQFYPCQTCHGPGVVTKRTRDIKLDGCTESNCRRCRTHPDHRGDMEHAGVGRRPARPQGVSDGA